MPDREDRNGFVFEPIDDPVVPMTDLSDFIPPDFRNHSSLFGCDRQQFDSLENPVDPPLRCHGLVQRDVGGDLLNPGPSKR